jgi:hypothetical protein
MVAPYRAPPRWYGPPIEGPLFWLDRPGKYKGWDHLIFDEICSWRNRAAAAALVSEFKGSREQLEGFAGGVQAAITVLKGIRDMTATQAKRAWTFDERKGYGDGVRQLDACISGLWKAWGNVYRSHMKRFGSSHSETTAAFNKAEVASLGGRRPSSVVADWHLLYLAPKRHPAIYEQIKSAIANADRQMFGIRRR